MANILITGANGFIGSHLTEKFLEEKHNVYCFVRKTSDLSLLDSKDIHLRYGDITDYQSLEKALNNIDIVIHNAGLASDWGSIDLFRRINLAGTKNIAEASNKNGISRIVFISTTAIYGFNHITEVTENSTPNPTYNYAFSKLEAEEFLFSFGRKNKIDITVIRPGNVYGPDDHTFMEKYINAMLKKQMAFINHGESLTCPTYVTNLTDAVYLAAFSEEAINEAFNITDGLEINWKEFTGAIAEELGIPNPKLSIPLNFALFLASISECLYNLFKIKHPPLLTRYRMYNGGTNYTFSVQKVKNLLKYTPQVEFKESIKNTVNWYKNKHIEIDW